MDTAPSSRGLVALLLFALACGSVPALAVEPLPLAIKGYDTVAYFEMDKAVPGKARYEYEWDEKRYRFASARHLTLFKANPARYAPRFGNICTSALAYGLPWEADPKIWEIREGRLYVFGSQGSHDDFKSDLLGVLAGAERNAERLRRGERPMPEKKLPAGVKAEFERIVTDLTHVLENQPKGD